MKCQWIGDNPRMKPVCMCDTVKNRNYCEEHLWQVYQKGTNLGKRKKDIRTANSVWDIESEINTVLEELEAEGFL